MKYFAAPWPHLSLISVIDILLVAVIIYELLALIKGTRAAYMLVGVAGLALAFYFSRAGDLVTLNWLLSTLLPYAVFAQSLAFMQSLSLGLKPDVPNARGTVNRVVQGVTIYPLDSA